MITPLSQGLLSLIIGWKHDGGGGGGGGGDGGDGSVVMVRDRLMGGGGRRDLPLEDGTHTRPGYSLDFLSLAQPRLVGINSFVGITLEYFDIYINIRQERYHTFYKYKKQI